MSHTEAKTTVNYRQHQQQFKLLTNFQLPMVAQTHRAGSTPAILVFLISTIFFAAVSLKLHYALPAPLSDLVNPVTGLPQISEIAILDKVRQLSEDIGYRTVGTREHVLGEQWMLKEVEALKAHCDNLVKKSSHPTIRHLECEVDRQEGSGTHRFDMMDRRVYKNYVNLSNVVFRLSNGTEASKEHAILVNAHLDSTLPTPGAADDALPCVLMLDAIRVLLDTPGWSPHYSIIFLWNNAEESLQDGSHLFATQHKWRSSARAVINLEAAGVSGPELLFQATSEEMIHAYSHVPRPLGSVLANDVFSSGILLSDTDFRQFQEYGNLTGLDVAIVGDSYLYHTHKDVVNNIEAGVAQHFGENLMALLLHLTSSASPLPDLREYTPPQTTYFAVLGKYFFMWKFTTSTRMYNTFFAISLFLAATFPARRCIRIYGASLLGIFGGLIGAVVLVNIVAVFMTRVLGKGMSWFAIESSALALYGGPAIVGLLCAQYVAGSIVSQNDLPYLEYASIIALHLTWTGLAVLGQAFGIGSSVVGFVWGISSFAALLLQYLLSTEGATRDVSLIAYAAGQLIPSSIGAELSMSLLDIFVPLTGRMGEEAPAEHIVATIVAMTAFLCIPFIMPLAHRLPRKRLRSAIISVSALSVFAIAVFSSGYIPAFDELHPRRLFILHTENITAGELSLHMAVSDSAPGVPSLAADIARKLRPTMDVSSLQAIHMDDWNADWDIIYPFSQFLTPYAIPLETPEDYVSAWTESFRISTEGDVWHPSNNSRSLTLVMDHPGLIWTVIAFDAHILAWSLDNNPVSHYTRHHVKEASFYGVNRWTIDLVVNATVPGKKPLLRIDFQGIQERGMWPGKKADGQGLLSMKLFEELDAWLDDRTGGAYDTMMMGIVADTVTV